MIDDSMKKDLKDALTSHMPAMDAYRVAINCAKAFRDVQNELGDKIQRAVLREHPFYAKNRTEGSEGALFRYKQTDAYQCNGRILNPEETFLMEQNDFDQYNTVYCKEAFYLSGLTDKEGHDYPDGRAVELVVEIEQDALKHLLSLLPDCSETTYMKANIHAFGVYHPLLEIISGMREVHSKAEQDIKKFPFFDRKMIHAFVKEELLDGVSLDSFKERRTLQDAICERISAMEEYSSVHPALINVVSDIYARQTLSEEMVQKEMTANHEFCLYQKTMDILNDKDKMPSYFANEKDICKHVMKQLSADPAQKDFVTNAVKRIRDMAIGDNLSLGQQEFFRDSCLKEQNGTLLTLYHGSPDSNIKTFREGSYFTTDVNYAEIYSKKNNVYTPDSPAPTIYAVYIKADNVFDTRNPECDRIFRNEYVKGGYSCSIDPYANAYPYAENGLPDWTEGDALLEFLQEKGYDYQGFLLDEGATGGYGEKTEKCGWSFVSMEGCEIKSISERNPKHSKQLFDTEKDKAFANNRDSAKKKESIKKHDVQR